jgi:PE-PPE domain
MRGIARSAAVTIAAIVGAALLAVTSTFTAAFTLTATTALIVPGTGTPKPDDVNLYIPHAVAYYVVPNATECATTCNPVGVPYIAQFWPFPFPGWGGISGAKWNDSVNSGVVALNGPNGLYGQYHNGPGGGPVVIFGYSQGATVVGIVKGQLAADNGGLVPSDVQFVLIGDPQRPNGGVFERLALLGTVPILDATFGNPTPTNTAPTGVINTTDIAFQYDGVADFPTYPINVLADLNAIAGFAYVHGEYLTPDGTPPSGALPYGYTADDIRAIESACQADSTGPNCQTYGDTLYITIPARALPIMTPILELATATGTSALVNPVVALVQPVIQTLIETGYDRTSYGTPTPFKLTPIVNPITLAADLIADIPEGIHAAVATIQSPTHTIPDLPSTWGPSPSPSPLLAPNDSKVTTLEDKQNPATLADKPPTTHRALTPVNLFARPNVLLTTGKPGEPAPTNPFGTAPTNPFGTSPANPFGTSPTNPFGNNVHPVRDAAESAAGAVSGVVKKVLGAKDDAA